MYTVYHVLLCECQRTDIRDTPRHGRARQPAHPTLEGGEVESFEEVADCEGVAEEVLGVDEERNVVPGTQDLKVL